MTPEAPRGPSAPPRLVAALADRYRLERGLGEGGMATVYLAEDRKHDRRVAVKVLRPELAAVVGAERFLAEIRTTATLQHPHILPLFDSGEADGFLYYVMPFIEGESLRERLEREKQLPVDEAVRIATDVAEALDHAHRHGVVHRDVKPANILLSDGRPLVADFGIALAVKAAGGSRLTETGLSLGTPYYMSPEQATGDRDADARSDVTRSGRCSTRCSWASPRTGARRRRRCWPASSPARCGRRSSSGFRSRSTSTPSFAGRSSVFRPTASGRRRSSPRRSGVPRSGSGRSRGKRRATRATRAKASAPRVVRATLELPPAMELALEPPAFTPICDGLIVPVEVDGATTLARRNLGAGTVASLPSGAGNYPFVSPDGDLVGFSREEVTGAPQPVVSDLYVEPFNGMATYAVSDEGTRAYVCESDGYRPTDVVRVDRSSGAVSPVGLPPSTYGTVSLSPDERSLAVDFKPEDDAWDILVVDIESGTHASRGRRGPPRAAGFSSCPSTGAQLPTPSTSRAATSRARGSSPTAAGCRTRATRPVRTRSGSPPSTEAACVTGSLPRAECVPSGRRAVARSCTATRPRAEALAPVRGRARGS